jgi:sporulation protein YlmC with PRC-barrel domain
VRLCAASSGDYVRAEACSQGFAGETDRGQGGDEPLRHDRASYLQRARTTMRKIWNIPISISLATMSLATAVLIATIPHPVHSQGVELIVVDVTTVAKGYRTSKLTGTSVTNDQNEKIGTVDDFVIDHEKVLFTVLQIGGFLGIGGHLVAVPYQSLVLDETGSKIRLPGATRDELKKLPEFKYAS